MTTETHELVKGDGYAVGNIDVAPTILEAVGVEAPRTINGTEQRPIEGVSMAYTFADANAPPARRTQYFELFANRALYHDGWIASTTPNAHAPDANEPGRGEADAGPGAAAGGRARAGRGAAAAGAEKHEDQAPDHGRASHGR